MMQMGSICDVERSSNNVYNNLIKYECDEWMDLLKVCQMMYAMMISDLEMKHDVPILYKIANVLSLRNNKDWHAIQNISMVKQMVKSGKVISTKQLRTLSPRTKAILRQRKQFNVNGDILMLKSKDGTGRIIISNNELHLLMKCCHEAQGNMGEDCTLDLIQSRSFWPGMKHSIINSINQCNRCT